MGRREPRQRFMPNVYVFPGGRVDPLDRRRAVLRELRPEVAAALEAKWEPARARALAVAAVRETYEETGLAFGRVSDGDLCPALDGLDYLARAITPRASTVRYHARFFLVAPERASGELGGTGELQDLGFVKLSDALELPIIDVTAFVLRQMIERHSGRPSRGVPFYHYHKGLPRIRYE